VEAFRRSGDWRPSQAIFPGLIIRGEYPVTTIAYWFLTFVLIGKLRIGAYGKKLSQVNIKI